MIRVSFAAVGALAILAVACSDRASLPTQLQSVPTGALSSRSHQTATPVTSTIADVDPATGSAFEIRSDGAGPYVNSSASTSVIQPIGDWVLDSYSQGGTRTVYLDFSRPVDGSGPGGATPVAITSGFYRVHMISKCSLYGTTYPGIASGATVACPLHIGDIYVGTQKYAVQMNPRLSSADTAWVETNYANVTCTSADTGSCSAWELTPSGVAPDGSASNEAALLAYTTSGSKGKSTTTVVKQGDFWMSFRIDVTNP